VSDSSYKRSWDDVCMYKPFFTELYEFDVSVMCMTVFDCRSQNAQSKYYLMGFFAVHREIFCPQLFHLCVAVLFALNTC